MTAPRLPDVGGFAADMRAQGIHVGLGQPGRCVTCDLPWPCPSSSGLPPEPPPLFDAGRTTPRFAGADYDHRRDAPRLTGQLLRVWEAMCHGEWRTLDELHRSTGDPHASISAQLRHLRKPRFGGHTVEKQHRGDPAAGLYEYRLIPNGENR